MNCKDCKHWKPLNCSFTNGHKYGECDMENNENGLIYTDSVGDPYEVYFSANFGCLMFEPIGTKITNVD